MEPPRDPRRRPAPPSGAPFVGEPVPPVSRWPEPPAFRAHPAPGSPACASCSSPIASRAGPPPLCWGCGRPLCVDCYWRHGLTPAAHQCASCLAHDSAPNLSISGGRSGAPGGTPSSP